MNKKNLYRILGIVISALIIVGMFLPYIKEPSYSLFKIYSENKQLVLPVVLLIFSLASLILYVVNRYIEFALSTSGAVLFYMITETVSFIKEDALSQIGIGFILMAAGGVLLIIVTFLAIMASRKIENKNTVEENNYQPKDMIQALENTSNSYAPVEPVQPVIPQPMVEPVISEPAPVVEPVQPVQPIVEPVQSVQPIVEPVQPVIPQPVVEPVQPVVAPVQPIVEPTQPISELRPIEDVAPQGLKPIEEQAMPTTNQFNPLPDIQFEPVDEPVQEIKPINPEPKEAPLNPVLQQFEIPTSFLNSGAPVKQEGPQSINTDTQPQQPSVGMDIFNNH